MEPAGDPPTATAPFRFVPVASCAMCGAGPEGFRFIGRRLDRHQGLLPLRKAGVSTSVVRCGTCGLVFPDPMPLPAHISDLYGVDPASYWPPEYFQPDLTVGRGHASVARELLRGGEGLRALDVGAGIGKGVLLLRRHGFRAVGLEPSETFRALAVERMGLGEDDILLGAVEDASFGAGSFDYVNFGAVLEHLRDPGAALGRALEWLRTGGIVHAEVPHAGWLLSRGLNLWYRLLRQRTVTNCSPMHPPYHLYEFTRRSFERAAARLSVRLERVEVWVGEVMAPRPFQRPLRALMERTGTGMQLAVWLRKP